MNRYLTTTALLIVILILGYLWYNQNLMLSQINKSQPHQLEQQTTDDEGQIINDSFEQIDKDFRTVDTWQKLECTPKTRIDCSKTSCTKSEPVVYLVLNRLNKTFSRCDKKSCDTYDAVFGSGGIYTNIQANNPSGMMIKVLGNREYTEMVTTGLNTILQNGNCSEIQ